jgi:hypothetical protein
MLSSLKTGILEEVKSYNKNNYKKYITDNKVIYNRKLIDYYKPNCTTNKEKGGKCSTCEIQTYIITCALP